MFDLSFAFSSHSYRLFSQIVAGHTKFLLHPTSYQIPISILFYFLFFKKTATVTWHHRLVTVATLMEVGGNGVWSSWVALWVGFIVKEEWASKVSRSENAQQRNTRRWLEGSGGKEGRKDEGDEHWTGLCGWLEGCFEVSTTQFNGGW